MAAGVGLQGGNNLLEVFLITDANLAVNRNGLPIEFVSSTCEPSQMKKKGI